MTGGLRHPYSRALYEKDSDGMVVVSDNDGALREADPQLCLWVAGPRTVSNRVRSVGPHPDEQ